MNDTMFLITLISVPLIAFLSFILCLILYLREKKKEISPDNEKAQIKLRNLHTACLTTGIIAAVFMFIIIAGAILFMMFMISM